MRHIPACIVAGQAAGTAAALCSQQEVSPKALDVGRLQARLLEQGVSFGREIPNPAEAS